MANKSPRRRLHQNVWGNWRGYLGRKWSFDFGTDAVHAGHWLLTGDSETYAGYATDATMEAAKAAALAAANSERKQK